MIYKRRLRTIEAHEITPEWEQILKEQGFKNVNLGDYYIEGLAIWPKRSFELEFEEVA